MTETQATLAPESQQTEQPPLGFGAKLISIFTNPRRVFASLGGGHEWIILWLITGAVSIGAYYPMRDIVKASQLEQVQQQLARNPGISEEQRQEILTSVEENFANPWLMLLVPVFQLVVLVVVAAILLFVANIVLGGNTRYLTMLNAYAWTMMIIIPASIITVPLVMAKGSMDVSLGLGVLTSEETGPFLKKFLSLFEIFGLWQVWLSALAVAVLGKAKLGKAFAAVFVCWLVWALIQSGLATLGVNFGM